MQAGTVILLAGGAGTRVRELYPHIPKPLIPVAGRPFLDWVCGYWARQGAAELVFSLGHGADAAAQHLSQRRWPGVKVHTIREDRPLGTGGALRYAARHPAVGDPFVAANADSLAIADISGARAMLADPDVDGVVLAVRVPDASRYGSLRIAPDGFLLGFEEKRPGEGWINAGVYFLRKRLLALFPDRTPLSMETEVFPSLLAAGSRLRVHRTDAEFLDIGTPESLSLAGKFIERNLGALEPRP